MNNNQSHSRELIHPFLLTLTPTFSALRNKNIECSWSLKQGVLNTSGRLSCWISGKEPDDFHSLAALLRQLHCPEIILEAQAMHEHPIIQGIGFSGEHGNSVYRLYLHGKDSNTSADHYESWRWNQHGQVSKHRYRFQYYSSVQNGYELESFFHEAEWILFKALITLPRFQHLSGFWFRYTSDGVLDQIDLAFPWQPSILTLPGMQAYVESVGMNAIDQTTLASFHLRHIAFKREANESSIMLYASATAEEFWSEQESDWQDYILKQSRYFNLNMEEAIFSKLPSIPILDSINQIGPFYDGPIDTWKKILGEKMHYHAGYFDSPSSITDEAMDLALDMAVRNLYPLIPKGSRVYDIGCGWGGPLSLLISEWQCHAIGLTVSPNQYRYISSLGYPVRLGDAERTLPPGYFDCILMMESFDHIVEKERLLNLLKPFSRRLVMHVNCQDQSPPGKAFGDTMHMIRSTDLKQLLERNGWTIKHWKNVRAEGLPSVAVWHRRLQSIPFTDDQHIETLRMWTEHVLNNPEAWAANNPLIEVMAEHG